MVRERRRQGKRSPIQLEGQLLEIDKWYVPLKVSLEPFRARFQTENRNRAAHSLVCHVFSVFLSFRTISIETATETGLYQSQLKV